MEKDKLTPKKEVTDSKEEVKDAPVAKKTEAKVEPKKVEKKKPVKAFAKLIPGVSESVLRAQLEEQYGGPVELIVEG